MRTSLRYLLATALAIGTLSACDVIEGPKVDPKGFTGSTNKVMVEDFTGHMCGNCPQAHLQAQSLKNTYGENVVVVAVHAGGFARVVPFLGYDYDFRTPMGTELEAHYQADALTGLPIGLVNRRLWNGGALTRFADWGSEVGTVLAEAPKMRMELTSNYNPTDRSISVDANLEYFVTGNADHQIVAIITEDSIIAQQEDYSLPAPTHVEDYVHMHVLRGPISTGGTWGLPVKNNTIVLGEKLQFTFDSVLDSSYVAKNCHVVVFVHNNATKEILQVEEIKLME
jgi:thiol-disulfide isomerase/thioredoxin